VLSASGKAIMDDFREHAVTSGSEILQDTVTDIQKIETGFLVKTPSKEFTTKYIVLATGNTYKKLGLPSEEAFL
jgi:thioredoxin reductase (NADPH)